MSVRFSPGLCSVTFRGLSVPDLVRQARDAGVEAIEWGGDVHVPAGDTDAAKAAAAVCADAGIACASYGSYLRAGDADLRRDFAPVLETALALGAGNIRVWAGRTRGADADAATWAEVRDDLDFMADEARDAGLTIGVEYHRGTLTEDATDAARLMAQCDRPNLFSYWQPVPGRGLPAWSDELDLLAPWLGYLHVFHWAPATPQDERLPLADGAADWAALLRKARPAPHWPHGYTAFLEFVRDDAPAQFRADMALLRDLCRARTPEAARRM